MELFSLFDFQIVYYQCVFMYWSCIVQPCRVCVLVSSIYIHTDTLFSFFCSTRHWTQGLTHTSQALCHWITSPAPFSLFLERFSICRITLPANSSVPFLFFQPHVFYSSLDCPGSNLEHSVGQEHLILNLAWECRLLPVARAACCGPGQGLLLGAVLPVSWLSSLS